RGRAGRTMKKPTIDKWGRAAALQAFGQGPKGGRIAQSSMAFAPLAPGSGVAGAPGSATACARAPRLLRAARQHDALPGHRLVTTRRECDATVPNRISERQSFAAMEDDADRIQPAAGHDSRRGRLWQREEQRR